MISTVTIELKEVDVVNVTRWERLARSSSPSPEYVSRAKVCQVVLSYAATKVEETIAAVGEVAARRLLVEGPWPPGVTDWPFGVPPGPSEVQVQLSPDLVQRLTTIGDAFIPDPSAGKWTERALLRHVLGVHLHFGLLQLYAEPLAEVTEFFTHAFKNRRGRRAAAA